MIVMISCKDKDSQIESSTSHKNNTTIPTFSAPKLGLNEAEKLAQLPLNCAQTEYPNKLSQTIGSQHDLKTPVELHPAFYGCFDWHSAVHGHWSMVSLLKQFPDIPSADSLKSVLKRHLSEENIRREVTYFEGKLNQSYERTYGWAWLLKLVEELHTWDDPLARALESNLQPLTDLIAERFELFLPKLIYPIRVGEHPNTAFGMSFAYDFAVATQRVSLQKIIRERALDFYLKDAGCPMDWEPSGHDFLSPCLEEMDIMRRILPKEEFIQWLDAFLPALKDPAYQLAVGEVGDRTDGHLVHLDGLNFSRAWCLYGLAIQYPEYAHLKNIANEHIQYSLPNLIGDGYEGGHWLGSFAIYALNTAAK